jgi:hypothetical protein
MGKTPAPDPVAVTDGTVTGVSKAIRKSARASAAEDIEIFGPSPARVRIAQTVEAPAFYRSLTS